MQTAHPGRILQSRVVRGADCKDNLALPTSMSRDRSKFPSGSDLIADGASCSESYSIRRRHLRFLDGLPVEVLREPKVHRLNLPSAFRGGPELSAEMVVGY
jgi:hypothetical protein